MRVEAPLGTPGAGEQSDPTEPTESGIRESTATEAVTSPPPALSYRVYSLAELEAREASLRSARRSIVVEASPLTTWRDPVRAAVGFVRAFRAWRTMDWTRGPLTAALRPHALEVVTETRKLARAADWKKLGTRAAIAAGGAFVLFVAALAAAEATDDLRPTRRPVRAEAALPAPTTPTAPTAPRVVPAAAAATPAAAPAPARAGAVKTVSRVTVPEPREIFIP